MRLCPRATDAGNPDITEKEDKKCADIPENSPQAAARILSLTIIADGDVSNAEFALLDKLAMHEKLGLSRDALHEVFDTFCADLSSTTSLPGRVPALSTSTPLPS